MKYVFFSMKERFLESKCHSIIFLLLSAFLSIYIVLISIPNESLVLYSDFYFPLAHSTELFNRYLRVQADWNYPEFNNPRQLMQLMYQFLIYSAHEMGLEMDVIQKVIISFLIFSGLCGVRLLLTSHEKVNSNNLIVFLCAGLLYLFNPYAISSVWQRINLGVIAYCLFPILVYVFIKTLRHGGWWYSIYGGVIILIAQSSNPVHLLSSSLLGILLASIMADIKIIDKNFFIQIFKLISIGLVVNLYWIIPFFLNISDQYAVSQNNLSSPDILSMRSALATKSTLVNWISLNPFWTAFEASIVKSSAYLKYCQSAVMILFAYALLTLGREPNDGKLRNFYLLVLLFVSSLFMVKYFLYLPFWFVLDALYIGAGFRDPFEKTAYFTNLVFIVFVYSTFLSQGKIRIAIVAFLTIFAVLPGLKGDLFYTQTFDPYQATGKIPEFFKDPDRIKKIIDSPNRILPIPFFEAKYGGQYKLDEGVFTGMTPLYWQNGVQIVSGNNEFSLKIEKAASSPSPQAVMNFYRLLRSAKIQYIFVSKNYICPKDSIAECERQFFMMEALEKESMVKVVNIDFPYFLFKLIENP